MPTKKQRVGEKTTKLRSTHPLVGEWEDPEKWGWVPVRYNHPLVGTWQEVENSAFETSVIYKVEVANGRFVVSGIDESDGTELKITNVRRDGECLKFTSLFPPTAHKAKHELRFYKPGLVKHAVTYTEHEIWRKRKSPSPSSRSKKNP